MKKLHIHFVGIKGVGMTPLAIIAKEAGCRVTGSDIGQEFITDAALQKAGITPLSGFAAEHIENPDLVIATGAHGGLSNIEVLTAKEKHIQVITQGEAVGLFMEGKIFGKKLQGISVAGTHGKTTTTAMIATILKANKLDPSYLIGTGDVGSLGAPGHFGKGKYFVAEADEYATNPGDKDNFIAKLLWQHPMLAVLTNIEFDHPDVYRTIDDVRDVFETFVAQLPTNGVVVACGDDREIQRLSEKRNPSTSLRAKTVTYGFNPTNNYVLTKVSISGEQMFFWVDAFGTSLGEFRLKVVGEHNALNALAAIITALEIGVPLEQIKKGLLAFRGSKRRLEFMGELMSGAKVYDDYGHHPTEIKTTLQALRKQYPREKIICIFQPHTYSRTKSLFDEFLRAYDAVDTVILTEIYASLREDPDPTITSLILADAMGRYHKEVLYLPQLSDVVEYINQKRFRHDTVIVTMGAGDVYTIHTKLQFV